MSQFSPQSLSGVASRVHEQHRPEAIYIRLEAHSSLTSRGARWFFLSVAIGPMLTSLLCLTKGFWPVLPFAGLELLLLALVLRHSMRRGRQQESITITESDVLVDALVGARPATTRFSRHWTRVKLRAPSASLHPGRLYLESHGRACEVGGFLTEDERAVLGRRLKRWVGAMNTSPSLAGPIDPCADADPASPSD